MSSLSHSGRTARRLFRLAVLADDEVKLWDVATGGNIASVGLSEEVIRGSFRKILSPDGKMLALLMSDKSIKLFDVKTGKEAKQ